VAVSLRWQDVCALELESIKLTRAHTSACRGPEAARSRSHVLDCSPAPFRLECLVDSAKVQEEKPGGGREAGENEVKRKSALSEKKKYARTMVSHLRKERFGVRSVLRSSALVTGEVIWAGRRAGARDKSNLEKKRNIGVYWYLFSILAEQQPSTADERSHAICASAREDSEAQTDAPRWRRTRKCSRIFFRSYVCPSVAEAVKGAQKG